MFSPALFFISVTTGEAWSMQISHAYMYSHINPHSHQSTLHTPQSTIHTHIHRLTVHRTKICKAYDIHQQSINRTVIPTCTSCTCTSCTVHHPKICQAYPAKSANSYMYMYPYFRKGIALCVNTHKDPQAAHHCENGNTSKHQSTPEDTVYLFLREGHCL